MDWIVKYRQFRRHGCLKIDLGFGQCCAGGRCHLSWVPWRNVGTKQITWNFLSFRQGTSIVAWWSSSSSSTFKLHQSQNALSGCRTLKSKGCNWYNVRTISSYADALTYSYHLLPSLTISYHLLPYLTCNHDFYWFLSISQASRNCSHELHEVLQAHGQVPGVACDLHTFSTACHPCVAEQKHQRLSVTQSFHRAKACLQGSFGARTYGQAPWKCMNSRKWCILVCSKINGSSAHIVHDYRENH